MGLRELAKAGGARCATSRAARRSEAGARGGAGLLSSAAAEGAARSGARWHPQKPAAAPYSVRGVSGARLPPPRAPLRSAARHRQRSVGKVFPREARSGAVGRLPHTRGVCSSVDGRLLYPWPAAAAVGAPPGAASCWRERAIVRQLPARFTCPTRAGPRPQARQQRFRQALRTGPSLGAKLLAAPTTPPVTRT